MSGNLSSNPRFPFYGHDDGLDITQPESGKFVERAMTPAELAAREPALAIAKDIYRHANQAGICYVELWGIVAKAMQGLIDSRTAVEPSAAHPATDWIPAHYEMPPQGEVVQMRRMGSEQIPRWEWRRPQPPSSAIRELFNKGVGVQSGNRLSMSFETEEEANRAFHYLAELGNLETSRPPQPPADVIADARRDWGLTCNCVCDACLRLEHQLRIAFGELPPVTKVAVDVAAPGSDRSAFSTLRHGELVCSHPTMEELRKCPECAKAWWPSGLPPEKPAIVAVDHEGKQVYELHHETNEPLTYPYKCKHSNHPGLCPECSELR